MSGQLHIGIVDGQHVVIYAANGFGMAEMIGPRMEKKKADANMLVEAVNNLTRVTAERDELLAALKGCVSYRNWQLAEGGVTPAELIGTFKRAEDAIRQVEQQ